MLAESLWGNHAKGGSPVIHARPQWRESTDSGPVEQRRRETPVVAAVVLVLVVEAALLYLLATRVVNVGTPQAAASGGPLRVRLVANQEAAMPTPPIPPVVTPVRPPEPKPKPKPQPQKKVVASKAPSRRVVKQPDPPKPQVQPVPQPLPKPVPVQPSPSVAKAPVTPVAVATGSAPLASTNANAGAHAGLPGPVVRAEPKEVGSLSCEVPQPDYPRSARRRGLGGKVVVRLVVDEHGKVASARVTHSSGVAALDGAAREAALQASCDPYREAGQAIRVTASQLFNFVPTD